jgi:putative DNA primase/helicase
MTGREFADRLHARRHGGGWMARGPAHDDRDPSLHINPGDDGRVLVRCFAGCSADAVVRALGLTLAGARTSVTSV